MKKHENAIKMLMKNAVDCSFYGYYESETTQGTPHKTTKKAMSLFIVTDKPQPVKLPHLKPLNNIPMYVERFKTDFKPLKNNKGYNTRVSNKKVA